MNIRTSVCFTIIRIGNLLFICYLQGCLLGKNHTKSNKISSVDLPLLLILTLGSGCQLTKINKKILPFTAYTVKRIFGLFVLKLKEYSNTKIMVHLSPSTYICAYICTCIHTGIYVPRNI